MSYPLCRDSCFLDSAAERADRAGQGLVSIPLQGFVLLGRGLTSRGLTSEAPSFNPSAGIRASWTRYWWKPYRGTLHVSIPLQGFVLLGRVTAFDAWTTLEIVSIPLQGFVLLGLEGSGRNPGTGGVRFNPSAGIRASWTQRAAPSGKHHQTRVSIPLQGFVLLGPAG